MKLIMENWRKFVNEEKSKGLWANIHAKRKRGEPPAKPGDEDYPETLEIEESEENKKEIDCDDMIKRCADLDRLLGLYDQMTPKQQKKVDTLAACCNAKAADAEALQHEPDHETEIEPLDEKKKRKKKKACKPSKGKRFAKRVKGKCRSFGQKGKAKDGGDRIRPGTKKGDAYCARSFKIKKCKNPPCANALSRKKWKCRGKKSVA